MTNAEIWEACRLFIQKWQGKGKEDEDDRSFWFDIFTQVLDVQNVTDRMEFQKKVVVEGNTKRIDAYIPETRVIIEQKSLGIALDKKRLAACRNRTHALWAGKTIQWQFAFKRKSPFHNANDKAVMQAYGLSVKETSEAACVVFLMKKSKNWRTLFDNTKK